MLIKVIRFNGYKEPKRAHYNDSGADVFATQKVIIPARSVVSIPTGVGLELPDGYDAVIHCKSGLSKNGIWASNSPVDAGYRGEIHAILYNTTDKNYIFNEGDKIGQLVIRPVIYANFVTTINEETRGANGFGSTGK